MKRLLKSAVLLTAFLASFAHCVKGQNLSPTNGPPESLPMLGSRQNMLEWIATNRPALIAYQVQYTSTNGALRAIGTLAFSAQFESYGAFRESTMTNGMNLYNSLLSRTDIASGITFVGRIFYLFPDGTSVTSLSILTNLGCISGITSDAFLKAEPNFVRAVVPVPNLEKFSIQVNSEPPYSFLWSNSVSFSASVIAPPPPPEFTTRGLVVLNEWYSIAHYRARFKITASGITKEYTQHGGSLNPAVLMISPCRLDIQMARGSDTTVETSTDLVNWTLVTNFVWSLGIENASVTINPVLPQQFYRAQSN